jgi:hypothetical protein
MFRRPLANAMNESRSRERSRGTPWGNVAPARPDIHASPASETLFFRCRPGEDQGEPQKRKRPLPICQEQFRKIADRVTMAQ